MSHDEASRRDRPAQGPPLDYSQFYRREHRPMVALAAGVSGSNLAAEDIAQEALVRAYRRWDRVGRLDKPGAWLRRVTINLALSNRKRAATELKARLRIGPPPTLRPAPVELDHVWAAVRTLPGQQRAAIALHYLEDRPVAEIAQILGCAESTAKVHLHRGRNALADLLTPGPDTGTSTSTGTGTGTDRPRGAER